MQWGDRWLAPAGPPVELRHHDCDQPVRAELRCDSGHQLAVADLELIAGPGGTRAGAQAGGRSGGDN